MGKEQGKSQPDNVRAKKTGKLDIAVIRYVSAPDAEARIARAIDILLGIAERNHDLKTDVDNNRGPEGEGKS